MSDDVISVNFGKEEREHARKLARLLGLLEDHHEDILRDPVKYIKMASEENAKLRDQIEQAREVWRKRKPSINKFSSLAELERGPVQSDMPRTLMIDQDDYYALKEMLEIIQRD